MLKILIAFDGVNFSEGAFDFARKLNEMQPVLLIGVFLPQADYANLWSYTDTMIGPVYFPLPDNTEEDQVEENISRFKSLCKKSGIECRVHKDQLDFALPELRKESRFADLLVIGSESFYENIRALEPGEHLKDILHGVECPVLIVPENYEFPTNNILSYDGSESSVYSIKQFAYIFPEMTNNPTLLVYAKEGNNVEIPDEINIEELAARHYKDLTITKLEINAHKKFQSWISEKNASILICGSFGRSSISQIFKKSFITGIIKEHKLPVFVTHKK